MLNQKKWNTSTIDTRSLPFTTFTGYTIDAGILGQNEWALPEIQRTQDLVGAPYANGTVDPDGYPLDEIGGYTRSITNLYENFHEGLKSEKFVILDQKKSSVDNVDIVSAEIDGEIRNVLRLKATAKNDGQDNWEFQSGALVQTADFFSSGFYSVRAKFPAVQGLVFSLWTFHYEEHYEKEEDPQFVMNATGKVMTTLNHEIDWEIPASCSSMCEGPDYCIGQYDTANLNTYLYETNSGYANVCARTPDGAFVDDDWHTYTFEWHSGTSDDPTDESGCTPKVHYFFDGTYVGTSDVFVPSRASRFVFGMWNGNEHWVGNGNWSETYAYVSDVTICPFDESFDAMYPQNYDQPSTEKKLWTPVDIPPRVSNQSPPNETCSGDGACQADDNRPDGCACEKSWQCASNWCEGDRCGGGESLL
eukprot:g229.t1